MGIRSEVQVVSPHMAAVWLQKNKRNRTINNKRVERYAREMREGKWYQHHQGIAFYEDGALADGQHRLAAIVSSGVSIEMLVTWGVHQASGIMIDGHQPRGVHQAIKIAGIADWIGKDEIATTKAMMLVKGGGGKASAPQSVSHMDLVNYSESHKQAICFAVDLTKNKKRFITTALLRASLACAFYYEDSNRLREFSNVLISGMPTSSDEKAAILLREWILEFGRFSQHGNAGRQETMKRIMRAIKAFCERQEIGKLYQPKEFIYLAIAKEDVRLTSSGLMNTETVNPLVA